MTYSKMIEAQTNIIFTDGLEIWKHLLGRSVSEQYWLFEMLAHLKIKDFPSLTSSKVLFVGGMKMSINGICIQLCHTAPCGFCEFPQPFSPRGGASIPDTLRCMWKKSFQFITTSFGSKGTLGDFFHEPIAGISRMSHHHHMCHVFHVSSVT